MNHIHKTVFNTSFGTWIVVSEKSKNSAINTNKLAFNLFTTLLMVFSADSYALPTGNELIAGQATVATPTTTQMQINQSSDRAVINWQGFSVDQNEAVHIRQPTQQSALLNRVVGQDASQIQGKIQANGQVYLVNPNGVMFSKTAQVDVGGLVATAHDIKNEDFMAGKNHFSQSRQGAKVENQGAINTSNSGVVALIGEQVTNTGTINTPKGSTVLAAGKNVDLDMKGDGLVEVKVTEAALNAQIENHGAINADSGRVVMTTKAANSLIDTVINQNGIVKARGLIERNGEIILDGGENGTVKVAGELNTGSTNLGLYSNGGNIKVTGNTIELTNTANVNASGETQGGNIQIGDKQSTQTVTLNQGSSVQSNATNGNAGHIEVLAKMDAGQVNVQGNIYAKATNKGNGGFIDTSAAKVKIVDTANINTQSKDSTSGSWLIDPYDFTIAATGGDITGLALSMVLNSSTVTIQTGAGSVSCAGATCSAGNAVGNGDIFVNDVVSWSANTLTLSAFRNININANLNASNTAKLALEYGQGEVAANNSSDYFLNNGSKVNLAKGLNFSTKLGSDGNINTYQVITQLGAENSMTGTDLQGMNGNLLGLYVLGSNIDASSTNNWYGGFSPVGTDWTTAFGGQFNGLGHTITGLTINRPSTSNVGLFGYTYAKISNVGLIGVNITGADNIGGLVGQNYGTINNSYATGNVTGNYSVGGLVGINLTNGIINNAYATGDVTGNGNVGGLVGTNLTNGIINNAYATGDVTGNSNVGGLVGSNTGTINNTYAVGHITGNSDVGGLVGANLYRRYLIYWILVGSGINFAPVTIVVEEFGNINNSYWNTETTGQTKGIGLGSSTSLTGKTTNELKQLSTFSKTGWNIANTGGSDAVWRIYEGNTYPLLRSFLKPLTIYSDGGYSLMNVDNSHLFGSGTNVFSDQQGYDIILSTSASPMAILKFLLARQIVPDEQQIAPLYASTTGIHHAHDLRWFHHYWLKDMFATARYSLLFNNAKHYLQALIENGDVALVNDGVKLPK